MTRGTWIGVALVGVLAAASVIVAPGRQSRAVPPGAAVAPAALSPAEAAFFRDVAPRLSRAARDAAALTEIGKRRSRNLLEIRNAQTEIDRTLDDLDAILARRPPPALFVPSLLTYRTGATAIRDAMDEAQAGFVRFDWDRVAAAYDLAETGAGNLRRAGEEITAAAGRLPSGTPAPPPATTKAA